MEGIAEENIVSPTLERAEEILGNLDISWNDIEDKRVIDIGSGKSSLAEASAYKNSTAKIYSVDIEINEKWLKFPWEKGQIPVQADAQHLPFKSESFDYAFMYGSVGLTAIPEAVRVLCPGGEMRMWPIAGQILEYWTISYYLDKEKNMSQQQITDLIENYNRQIEEADGFIPNAYVALRKEALDGLLQEEKLEVIDLMAKKYSEILDLKFTYKVKNPKAHEPNAVLIYKKE